MKVHTYAERVRGLEEEMHSLAMDVRHARHEAEGSEKTALRRLANAIDEARAGLLSALEEVAR